MAVLLSDWLVIAESFDPQRFRGDVRAPKKRPHTFRSASTPSEGCGCARRGYGRAVATAGKQLPEGTVTFLFTDIEGSTPLLDRLGAERYRELLELHRQLLRNAVAAAAGFEIRAEADSFFAAFPRADEAASAAVAAQRALEAQDWPADGRLRVRIGLHTGEATLAGDDYVGLAVHRARRVCDAGHGGQVLASSATAELVGEGLPAGVSLKDLGDVRLAGFEAPERLTQLSIEGLPDAFPEPRAARPWREERPVLLERAEELASVDRAIAGSQASAGGLVAIEGPAGIGKTSLLAEARSRASDAAMRVLQARGSELERSFSHGVVRQLFEALLAHADPAERTRLLDGAAAHAAALFESEPVLGRMAASEDAAFAQLHGLYWLTLNVAEAKPLLIAVDDLQWADPPSLRWLAFLARRLSDTGVCVLATVRPIGEEDPSLAELLADPSTNVVRPTALTPAAAAELVRDALSAEADDEFCRACHGATGGNPLLLHELLRTLIAEDIAPSAGSIPAVERLAPHAVARSVRLRLARLSPEAVAVARAVAVLGDGAGGAHVAALAGIERRLLAPSAAALARADLLGPEPPLRFVHPVVRNAVYESIAPHEREQEHARAAEALAAAGAPGEEVAAQLLLAPPESVDGAVTTLREVAGRAAAEGAPESAASYLRRALEEPVDDEQRADLLLELARAEASLGSRAVVERLREAISLLRDPERRRLAYLELGRALYWSQQEEEAIRTLEGALAEREGEEDDLQRRLEAELIANATRLPSQHEEARRRLDGLDVGAEQGPGARMLLGLRAYHDATRGTNRDRAIADAEQALSAMFEEERAWSYVAGLYVLLFTDRLDEAVRFIDRTIADVRKRGAVFNFSGMAMTRAIFGYARGTLAEAEADARMALDALPHRGVLFTSHTYGWLAQVLVERGAVDEAADVLLAVEEAFGGIPAEFAHVPLLRARALVSAARGDHSAALADALAAGHALSGVGHENPAVSYPGWRSEAALAHHALGADDDALALAREEVELARAWGAPRALGRALRVAGLVERGAQGIERIREAVEILEQSPARLEYAYAVADLGAALRRGNRRAQAREHLRSALELAQRCGATRLAERAHEELVAAGARPRRLVMSGVESLTPSERRTAALAAEGLTNKEIAQALFVMPRTVEMHLSNTFRKLDISTRTQLPAALAASAPGPVAAGTT
jgi:class 3 adenylate cyclase/DNA-binding CsgD family transcriptional regulator